MKRKMAILIDGGFFTKIYTRLFKEQTSEQLVDVISEYAQKHCEKCSCELYRIFYYDCEPLSKRVHLPITKQNLNFEKTPQASRQQQLFKLLRKTPNVALRLGSLSSGDWELKPWVLKKLLKKEIKFSDLVDTSFRYDIHQKGVDMKIGLDIASLAYKKQVDKIVLISGDSDFIPAAKLARREGIEFILDHMGSVIKDTLHEHLDNLYTFAPSIKTKSITVKVESPVVNHLVSTVVEK